MKITGETMIFATDFENGRSYSTTIRKKVDENTYEKMYIQIQFRKDISLENKTRINILDGFLTFYKTKNGIATPKIVVLSFDTVNNNEEIQQEDSLPF